MKSLIVDASVAVKWLMPEPHSAASLRLLDRNIVLAAPDIILAEVGNVLWKKWRRAEIESASVPEMIADFRKIPLRLWKTELLVFDAWNIAQSYVRSYYDSLYICIAQRVASQMVTADLKLYNALKETSLKKHVLWVEDIP